jgi:uncharacterized protein (TIGR01777 family)
MRVAITGATGFIGRALVARLQRDGHHVTALSRSPARARGLLGEELEIADFEGLARAVDGSDAVINLAGENVLARRWSRARKTRIEESRVGVTQRVVDAIASARNKPRVLVSASAVGFYGERGLESVDERAPRGAGFLAELCERWESTAESAEDSGVRVVLPRIGIVLGPEGGAWPALRRAFDSGFGGVLGDGTQMVPWIHLDDAVEALITLVSDPGWNGPVNLTAPSPLTNEELSRTIAQRLGRSLGPAAPAWLLRLGLGERADALLHGQRALPRALESRGFSFLYGDLGSAVDALLALEDSVHIAPASVESADSFRWGRARHTLTQVTELDAGLDEVYAYFSRAQNLGPMTPAWTEFEILGEPPAEIEEGETIDYRLKLGPVPVRWRTLIARWQPGQSFVDVQARGAYSLWWHEHRFEVDGARTRMVVTVHYALPFGPLGRLVHRWFVARTLRRIFGFRRAAMAFRFGVADRAMRSAA